MAKYKNIAELNNAKAAGTIDINEYNKQVSSVNKPNGESVGSVISAPATSVTKSSVNGGTNDVNNIGTFKTSIPVIQKNPIGSTVDANGQVSMPSTTPTENIPKYSQASISLANQAYAGHWTDLQNNTQWSNNPNNKEAWNYMNDQAEQLANKAISNGWTDLQNNQEWETNPAKYMAYQKIQDKNAAKQNTPVYGAANEPVATEQTTDDTNDMIAKVDANGNPVGESVDTYKTPMSTEQEAILSHTHGIDMSTVRGATADLLKANTEAGNVDYEQAYNSLKNSSGLNDLKDKITKMQDEMVSKLRESADDPYLGADGHTQRDTEIRNAYTSDINNAVSLYNSGISDIQTQLGYKKDTETGKVTAAQNNATIATNALANAITQEANEYNRKQTEQQQNQTALAGNVTNGIVMSDDDVAKWSQLTGLDGTVIKAYNQQAQKIADNNALSNEQKVLQNKQIQSNIDIAVANANTKNFTDYVSNYNKTYGAAGVSSSTIYKANTYNPVTQTFQKDDGTAWQVGDVGGQCGHFVNQLTGLTVGDSFDSKEAVAQDNNPIAGGVFVDANDGVYYNSKTGQSMSKSAYEKAGSPAGYTWTGHIGMVKSVSADGKTFTALDSNFNGDQSVLEHQMSVDDIVNNGGGFGHGINVGSSSSNNSGMLGTASGVTSESLGIKNTMDNSLFIDASSYHKDAGTGAKDKIMAKHDDNTNAQIQMLDDGDASSFLTGEPLALVDGLKNISTTVSGKAQAISEMINNVKTLTNASSADEYGRILTNMKLSLKNQIVDDDTKNKGTFSADDAELNQLTVLKNFAQAAKDSGLANGTVQDLKASLGKMGDEKIRALAQASNMAVSAYTKMVSGVSFTTKEMDRYATFFPDGRNDEDVNLATIDNFQKQIQTRLDSVSQNYMGTGKYTDLLSGNEIAAKYGKISPEYAAYTIKQDGIKNVYAKNSVMGQYNSVSSTTGLSTAQQTQSTVTWNSILSGVLGLFGGQTSDGNDSSASEKSKLVNQLPKK